MNPVAGGIRTPDQRLRVFVSSTLKELAPERRAVRAAVERLALAPVMFELGARPHPPRSLYRAYLDQSDIFVGVYWEQYGWVAPGEEVSGLEDEWNLAPDIPKLIYLKRSEHRQERLDGLIGRIRDSDGASYVEFTDAAALADLVTSDLATLLAERFDAGAGGGGHAPLGVPTAEVFSTEPVRPPSPLTRLVGRGDELATLSKMLTSDGQRLVTVTGPGGIGKSRLAVAAARDSEPSFPDGVVFVDLAPVVDADLVISAVANAMGIRDTGDRPVADKVAGALAGRRVLLLLDNVEQVVDAAPKLSALLAESAASVLATSRILLRVRGEQNLPLGPLQSPEAGELFVERARAVKPDFELTDDNARQVITICGALDNVPLALELAAARLRVLTPTVLMERLDHALPLLVGGARDLPERQRTLRATIEWSAQLLTDAERELLLRLGVFRRLRARRGRVDVQGPQRSRRRRSAGRTRRRQPRARAGSWPSGLVHDAGDGSRVQPRSSCRTGPTGRIARPACRLLPRARHRGRVGADLAEAGRGGDAPARRARRGACRRGASLRDRPFR